MKSIFKFTLIWALTAAFHAPARADEDGPRTTRHVLRELFPRSERVSFVEVAAEPRQRAAVEKRLGYRLSRPGYHFYLATTRGRIDGYAFIDDELGQHEPITFAVKLGADGSVERHEVLVYREAWGEEIRNPRFRRQFVGKTSASSLRLNVDIDAVSGATISSAAMVRGVRRALVLFDVAVRPAAAGKR